MPFALEGQSSMPFEEKFDPPPNHPITPERARVLMSGDLPDVYRDILRSAVAPIYWSTRAPGSLTVMASGTLTFVQSGDHVFGVTAFHVLEGYRAAIGQGTVHCQVFGQPFEFDVIDQSEAQDLVTVRLHRAMIPALGKLIVPLTLSEPPLVVAEGRGIMLGGYPGLDRIVVERELSVDWGLFVALGVARRVTTTRSRGIQIATSSWNPQASSPCLPTATSVVSAEGRWSHSSSALVVS
jgi:hypothetical protein